MQSVWGIEDFYRCSMWIVVDDSGAVKKYGNGNVTDILGLQQDISGTNIGIRIADVYSLGFSPLGGICW